jgi:hypothetical protein
MQDNFNNSNDNSKEREVSERVTKIIKEQVARHNQALTEKDRQIEAAKLQSTINIEEVKSVFFYLIYLLYLDPLRQR